MEVKNFQSKNTSKQEVKILDPREKNTQVLYSSENHT